MLAFRVVSLCDTRNTQTPVAPARRRSVLIPPPSFLYLTFYTPHLSLSPSIGAMGHGVETALPRLPEHQREFCFPRVRSSEHLGLWQKSFSPSSVIGVSSKMSAFPSRCCLYPWNPSVPFIACNSPSTHFLCGVPPREKNVCLYPVVVLRGPACSNEGTREGSRQTDVGLSLSFAPFEAVWF